jgi:hypothetical protein
LPQPQSFYSADALVTLFWVLLMALTSVALTSVAEAGMADTTSMAIISLRVISMEADSMPVDFMAVAVTGRREEEMTDDKQSPSVKRFKPTE